MSKTLETATKLAEQLSKVRAGIQAVRGDGKDLNERSVRGVSG